MGKMLYASSAFRLGGSRFRREQQAGRMGRHASHGAGLQEPYLCRTEFRPLLSSDKASIEVHQRYPPGMIMRKRGPAIVVTASP